MDCTRRNFVGAASAALLGLAACARREEQSSQAEPPQSSSVEEPKVDLKEFEKLELDMKAWKHDEKNDVYYQLGVPYCLKPASNAYESLAIFVPGAYLKPMDDSKKPLYQINESATVGKFTPKTAPVIMPINSGNFGPQASPAAYSYTGLDAYLKAGCVYVYAGMRGRSSGFESTGSEVYSGGDPWPVVDLKAAVRFVRYNAETLPGDTNRIFTFGFSFGGGVSALMGCTGDSKLYTPYLEQIGAATHDAKGEFLSDAVFGSASWCPITSFDTADSSYEWMMGQYFGDATRAADVWTKHLSNDLAQAYAHYINEMDLRDSEDHALVLDETAGDFYTDGSYYAYVLDCVQESANTFFSNTQFPYTYTPQHLVNGNFPGDPNLQSMGAGASDVEAVTGDASAQAAGVAGKEEKTDGKTNVQSVVYDTEEDYINDLNGDAQWLTYNQTRSTVRISSVADFVRHVKPAAKDVCAFDAVDRSTVVNQLFGNDEISSLHFSKMVSDQISGNREAYAKAKGWNSAYVKDWSDDLAQVDALKTDISTRMNMFNPLYFLSGHYEGYGSAKVASHWRINSGLFQTDTSLCTEMNLALALGHYDGIASVSFTPVWGQGHTLAEVSGTAEENLLAWIAECCK